MIRTVREGWRLRCTCQACPEQWEMVDHRGEVVAYFRLRWGWLTVSCPDVGGVEVLRREFAGEPFKGAFDDDEERWAELGAAVDAADQWWRRRSSAFEADRSM